MLDDNSGDPGGAEAASAGMKPAPSDGTFSRGISGMGFHTLDDFSVRGKRVLLRIDINSPVDERTLRLVDGSKIRSSIPTIRELLDRCAKLAIIAHQGRPGDYDFIPLNEHAAFMTQYLGRKVRYVDDLTGAHASRAIEGLGEGDCILLKNVRHVADEQAKKSPEEHAESELVKALAPKFDLFVNDAFGSSHRSHASLVGFTAVLLSAAGRLMEQEVRILTRVIQNPARPSTFIFGGAKFADAIPIIEKLSERETCDDILVAGLLGYAFLWATGCKVGSRTEDLIRKDATEEAISSARSLFERHSNKIHLPVDAAVDDEGKRAEYTIDDLPSDAAIKDIGSQTLGIFSDVVRKSRTVFLSGPPGVFEKEEFKKGT